MHRVMPRREAGVARCSAEGGPANAINPQPAQLPALSRRQLLAAALLVPAVAAAGGPAPALAESVLDGQGSTQFLPLSGADALTQAQKKILDFNRRTQRQNGSPPDFPGFLRDGYDMTVLAGDGYQVAPREGAEGGRGAAGSGALAATALGVGTGSRYTTQRWCWEAHARSLGKLWLL